MLAPIAPTWIAIHLALIPLFAGMGWAFSLLLKGVQGPLAVLCRWGAGIWALFSVAYESAIGLTSGIVTVNSLAFPLSVRAIVQKALTTYLYSPVFNDMALFLMLTGLGTVLLTVVVLWRAGAPRLGVFLFLGSLLFAWAHESPFGPLGNAFFLLSVVSLELFWLIDKERVI